MAGIDGKDMDSTTASAGSAASNPSPYDFDEWGDDADDGGAGGGENLSAEEMTLLARITDSAFSGAMFERKGAARQIVEAFKQTYDADDLIENVLVVIEKLVKDEEQAVRSEIMEHIPQIARFCHETGPQLDFVVPQHILPYMVSHLSDPVSQVRGVAQTGLLILLQHGILTPQEVAQTVFPVILKYVEPYAHDEHRTEMTMFISKLAPLVGKEVIITHYLKRFCRLCEDKISQVRRVCATSMADITGVIGVVLTEKVLLPRFLTLCEDDIWAVRKGCAEVFTEVSKTCSMHIRNHCLAHTFNRLLEDQSRWVRMSAFQSLGLFISTFSVDDRPPVIPRASPAEELYLQELRAVPEEDRLFLDKMRFQEQEVFPELSDSRGDTWAESLERVHGMSFERTTSAPVSYEYRNVVGGSQNIDFTPTVEETSELSEHDVSFVEEDNYDRVPMDFSEANTDTAVIMSKEANNGEDDLKTAPESELDCHEEDIEMIEITDIIEHSSDPNNSTTTTYNTFQYWRVPLPEIELDIEMSAGDGQKTNPTNKTIQDSNPSLPNFTETKSNVFLGKFNELELKGGEGQEDAKVDSTASGDASDNLSTSGSQPDAAGDKASSSTPALYSFVVKKQSPEVKEEVSEKSNPIVVNEQPVPSKPVAVVAGNSENLVTKRLSVEEDDWGDNYLDSDYAGQGQMYPDHNLPYIVRAHGPSGNRGRLLQTLAKPYSVTNQNVVPPNLLMHFLSMSDQQRDSPFDSELPSYCVFSFPAIVVTLGPENWSILRDCFEKLACKFQWKIRYTLAAALHEIANVLGPELSERDLVPFYDAMTKDLDEVRIGVLANLSKFVTIIGQEERVKVLNTLSSFLTTDNRNNWRFRLELSNQLGELTDMYEPEQVFKHLCPISLELTLDPISEVRRASLRVVARQVSRLSLNTGRGDPSLVREFLLNVVDVLCHNTKWVHRQSFAALAGHLVTRLPPTQFAQDILPHLISLSTDKVPNVRLVVAQTLTSSVMKLEYFSDTSNPHNEIILNTIEKLQCDTDRDVRFFSSPVDSAATDSDLLSM